MRHRTAIWLRRTKLLMHVHKERIAFVLAILILVFLGTLTFKSTQMLISSTNREMQSLKVIANLDNVVSLVKDAQIGVQGYVITGREHLLNNYYAALKAIPREIEILKDLTFAHSDQRKRVEVLTQLIDAGFDEMNNIVSIRKRQGFPSAAVRIRTDKSKDLMDKIRVLAKSTVDEKSILLKNRPEEVKFAVKLTNIVLPSSFFLLLIASFVVRRHIKKRKAIEAELLKRREEALDASHFKSVFLANMSHEIRTPMNGIIGMTELILETPMNDQQRKYAELINMSASNLLRIVNVVLDVSKIEAGKIELNKEVFSIYELVINRIDLLSLQAKEKRIQIESHVAQDVPLRIVGDPVRFDQILTNLIGNSIKFTPEGGKVSVGVRKLESIDDDACVTLLCEVTDNGIGIAEDVRHKLFKPFSQADSSTTRKYGGTGLGLSICRHLIELMSGEIQVESEQGKGARFWFTVKMALPDQSNSESSASSFSLGKRAGACTTNGDGLIMGNHHAVSATKRILVAEDNLINQLIVIKQLESMGYEVTAANNGREVLGWLKRESFDLVLMDCQMPEMDGYQATREIRLCERQGAGVADKLPVHLPIIALTANAMQGDAEICKAAGMDDYLAKPVKKPELAKMIDRWMS